MVKVDTVILEYVLGSPKCKNDEILVCFYMKVLAASRIMRTQHKLLHLELRRPSRIVGLFIRWILLLLIVQCPFNKIKIL